MSNKLILYILPNFLVVCKQTGVSSTNDSHSVQKRWFKKIVMYLFKDKRYYHSSYANESNPDKKGHLKMLKRSDISKQIL
jgi:hypothetical protein